METVALFLLLCSPRRLLYQSQCHSVLHCCNLSRRLSGETRSCLLSHCITRTTALIWLIWVGTVWLFYGFPWHEQQKLAECKVPLARSWFVSRGFFLLSVIDQIAQEAGSGSGEHVMPSPICSSNLLLSIDDVSPVYSQISATLWSTARQAPPLSGSNHTITNHWYCFRYT